MHHSTSELTMTVLMTPDKANFIGNVHGGDLLKLLDQAAYACASRFARKQVVTISVDQVIFRQPIHVGELVTCYASVNYTGNTSIEIGIKVIAENFQSQIKRHVNSCFITMVAIDENGKPSPVPLFTPKTPDELRRHKGAQLRKALRRQYEEESLDIRNVKAVIESGKA